MPYCKGCHNEFSFSYLNTNGYCVQCADERGEILKKIGVNHGNAASKAKNAPLAPGRPPASIVMTTETALDIPITQRLGIVTAEAVVGMNIIKDMMLEVRDLVGGRSKTQQNAMRDIKEELFDRLRNDAARLNADMVVGVDLRFSDFGSRGNAILATAIGTAIKVEKDGKANPTTTNGN